MSMGGLIQKNQVAPAQPEDGGARMSISDILEIKHQKSGGVEAAAGGGGKYSLKSFEVPWYIIDHTGEITREQRRVKRSQKRMDDLAALETEADKEAFVAKEKTLLGRLKRIEPPTLYPTWDAVTAIALIFTAVVTPYEVHAAMHAASRMI